LQPPFSLPAQAKLPSRITTTMATLVAVCALIVGGYYLWSEQNAGSNNGKEQSEETLARLTSIEAKWKASLDELQEQVSALRKKLQEAEDREAGMEQRIEGLEQQLKTQIEVMEQQFKNQIEGMEQQLKTQIDSMEHREKAPAAAKEAALAPAEVENEQELEKTTEETENGTVSSDIKVPSEGEKRKTMIEEELSRLVKEAEEKELEEPFDEDSLAALKKAALKICYLKKYYDVMKDELVFFPSVTKTLVNYSLIEEAEKFYFEEEDEYPQDLAIGLRSVATAALVEADDDTDEDYMEKLALDVEI
jgi:TolA-binding protein